MQPKSTIIFIPVSTNQAKIACICHTIERHFSLGESIFISVANSQVEKYVDELLWKYPQDSFIPHVIAHEQVLEKIVISSDLSNYNQAQVLFNLRSEANPMAHLFETVYDLYDETDQQKLAFSKNRHQEYLKNGLIKN